MSDHTPSLALPYLLPSQAQKHVIHNEAIRKLDALAQICLKSAGANEPPSDPAEGDTHAIGADPSGAWAGKAGQLAIMQDGAWMFAQPRKGWTGWLADGAMLVVHDGTAWTEAERAPTELHNVTLAGIGTSASEPNRLSVSSPASLFSHAGGGHQMKINKAAENETASMLFQSGWSGHGEIGLSGDNDLALKSSADGANWNVGIRIDAGTGIVSFPCGVRTGSVLQISGRWYAYEDLRWVGFSDSYGAATENYNRTGGTGAEPAVAWSQLGPFLMQGASITGLRGSFRSSSAEVTHIDIRLCFQYGPWDGTWDSNGETIRDTVYSADSVELFDSDMIRHIASFPAYDCPEDGHVIMYIRPHGTLTAVRYVHSSLGLEFTGAG